MHVSYNTTPTEAHDIVLIREVGTKGCHKQENVLIKEVGTKACHM